MIVDLEAARHRVVSPAHSRIHFHAFVFTHNCDKQNVTLMGHSVYYAYRQYILARKRVYAECTHLLVHMWYVTPEYMSRNYLSWLCGVKRIEAEIDGIYG